MKKLFKLKLGWIFFIFIVVDMICAGMGMGVPVVCILLGFFTGWAIIRIILLRTDDLNEIFTKSIKYGIATTLITFLFMLVIWGGAIIGFLSHDLDFRNFGHPLILYDPEISFFGWLALMIVISPLLQLLTTVFSCYLTLFLVKKKENTA